MIIDSVYEINKALDEGKKVLVEGANAPMLDIPRRRRAAAASAPGPPRFPVPR